MVPILGQSCKKVVGQFSVTPVLSKITVTGIEKVKNQYRYFCSAKNGDQV